MPELTQVNVSMSVDDLATLDELAREDGYDNRSAFIRRLIRNEKARRYPINGVIANVTAPTIKERITEKNNTTATNTEQH